MALPSRRHALERLLRQLEEEGIAALGQYWADAEVTGFLREYLSREDAALLQIEVDFALPDARFRERGPLPSGWRGSERLLAAFHSIGVSWGESHSHRILLADTHLPPSIRRLLSEIRKKNPLHLFPVACFSTLPRARA